MYNRQVVVVENEPLLRDLIGRALEVAGFAVTTAANAADARRVCKQVDPDAMIVDIELGPGPNGFDLVDVVKTEIPEIGVVFLTNLPDPRLGNRDAAKLPKNAAYLHKSKLLSGEELIQALEAVLKENVPDSYRHNTSISNPYLNLSKRQLEVLQLLAAGSTNSQIAKTRGTSLRAVEAMVSRIFDILEIDQNSGGNPRVEAAARYYQISGKSQ
ncbi:MAG: hypothetical protein RLZZ579_50 [Actinomycetota bacterium]|jgi:DNA-binding NarL/FixJ family response regulator